MLQQFISTILAFVTSIFGGSAALPLDNGSNPSPSVDINTYTTNISSGYCFDDFSFTLYNPETLMNAGESLVNLPSKPQSTDLLVQRCGGAEGQTILTAQSLGDYEPYTYTLTFTDLKQGLPAKNITFSQDFQTYGPGCRVTDVTTNEYSEEPSNLWPIWEKVLITCAIGDGGFSATEKYSVDLATDKVDLIARCDSRPIAILNSAGEVAHLDSTSDCTYPFGTGEGGLE